MTTIKVYTVGIFDMKEGWHKEPIQETKGINFGVMAIHHKLSKAMEVIESTVDNRLAANGKQHYYVQVEVMDLEKYVHCNNINLTVEEICHLNMKYGTSYEKFDW